MMQHAEDRNSALLLPYIAGELDAQTAAHVTQHVAECASCQRELASWQSLGRTWRDTLQVTRPPDHIYAAIMGRIASQEESLAPHGVALQTMRAMTLLFVNQVRLTRRSFWLASAIVMSLGWFVAASSPASSAGLILQLVAPLVAAYGVSMIYYSDAEPFLEIIRATPTSPHLLLLTRFTLVCGYDLLLALAATVGLAAISPSNSVGTLVLGWLGPMLFLSTLALLLAQRWGAVGGMAAAWSLWAVRVLLAANDHMGVISPGLTTRLSAYWSTNTLTLVGALIFMAVVMIQPTYRRGP
jgi:hypothetical protein